MTWAAQHRTIPLWGLVALLVGAFIVRAPASESSLWLIQGMLACSLTLVWGRAGIFSIGQTAMFGLGAYAYAVGSINLGETSVVTAAGLMIVSALLGLVAAALIGYFIFWGDLSPIGIAIITMGITLILYSGFIQTAGPDFHIGDAALGGFNGMVGIPQLTTDGAAITDQQFLALVGAISLVTLVCLLLFMRTPVGRVADAIRINPRRAALIGYNVRARRLAIFALGGFVAGLSGALFAAWGGFVSPEVFSLGLAVQVILWVLIGTRTSFIGAFVGAIALQGLSSELGGENAEYTPLIVGLVLIVVVLVLPGGVIAWMRSIGSHEVSEGDAETLRTPDALPWARQTDPTALRADDLARAFGGVRAVDGVSLELTPIGMRCIIGPNGAGKSTLFGLLSGEIAPTDGIIRLGSRDISRLPVHRRARAGIGVKLQTVSLFGELSVHENIWLSAYAMTRSRSKAATTAEAACRALRVEHHAQAQSLSHGEQQWLDLAVVIAGGPSVLMLDEPTAGMARPEAEITRDIIKGLAQRMCVVVIEHDMGFVRSLDAPVTVLHSGKVIAHGELSEVERDSTVIDVYLGRGHVHN